MSLPSPGEGMPSSKPCKAFTPLRVKCGLAPLLTAGTDDSVSSWLWMWAYLPRGAPHYINCFLNLFCQEQSPQEGHYRRFLS